MPTVTLFDRDALRQGSLRAGDDTQALLCGLGVDSGTFPLRERAISSTPLLTYARELNVLQRRYDVVMTDRVRLRPWQGGRPFPPAGDPTVDWPEPDHEHRHDDREIRVVLEGRLRCLLRTAGGHAAIVLEPGEWLALPAGAAHALQAHATQGVELLRLFSRPHGWVATATGAALPRRLLHWPVVHPPLALAA
jgi:cupin superfamily acireductone dioxygenase involved in methionine salvage